MKYLTLITIACIGIVNMALAQALVTDPIADFAQLAHAPNERLLKLEVDLNHEGKRIIFLSRTNLWAGKEGNIWSVYIPVADGYRKVEETDAGYPITFRPDRYFIGRMPGAKGSNLLMMFGPSGGGKGTLLGYQIVDSKVHEVTIKENFEPDGADKETYKKTFGSHFTRSVQELDFPKQ